MLAACGSADDAADSSGGADVTPTPVATTLPVATTTVPATTTAATTTAPTTTVAPTTVPVEATGLGIVWNSTADPGRVNAPAPAPSWTVGAATATLDMVLLVPYGVDEGLQLECGAKAQFDADLLGVEPAEQCAYLQWRFSTSSAAPQPGRFQFSHLVTVEGRRVEVMSFREMPPGTEIVDGWHVPWGGVGSQAVFSLSDGAGNAQELTYVVPPLGEFQPIFFS